MYLNWNFAIKNIVMCYFQKLEIYLRNLDVVLTI